MRASVWRPAFRGSGAEEIRTPDLIIANDALYQLSYRPRKAGSIRPDGPDDNTPIGMIAIPDSLQDTGRADFACFR